MDHQRWKGHSHEAGVEKFYASGMAGFHEYHGGYLNFGLWDRPEMSYLEAAENLVAYLGQVLNLNEHSHLLDAGSGMGAQDIYLARHFSPAAISAIDVTWKHVERSRERQERAGIAPARLKFYHGTATRLPFADCYFTHALSIEAPEHMDTREDFFREAYRVLKPGGVLVCADYSLPRPPSRWWEKALLRFVRWLWHVPAANVYGNDVFRQKLGAIGWRHITIDNIGARVIPGYYFENRRTESRRALRKIRGFWKGVVGGFIIDWGVYAVYRLRLCEYIIVRAEKP